MGKLRIEYSAEHALRVKENIRRGAIETAFEDIRRNTDRLIEYLSRFLQEFEYAQRELSCLLESCRIQTEELRKQGSDTRGSEYREARLFDLKRAGGYCIGEIRDALERLRSFEEGAERAVFWSKELSRSALDRLCGLMESMDDYMNAEASEPDIYHRQVPRIGKLTDKGE